MHGSLPTLAVISLSLSAVCSLIILVHLLRGHRQHMWIMNIVWVVTALYAGPFALWAYFRWGVLSTQRVVMQAKHRGEMPPGHRKPFWQMAAVGTLHCGSGCTLGDVVAETFLLIVPLSLFGKPLFAAWALDYVLALLFGVAFQYFTIKPMRGLSAGAALKSALKADVLSLTAWQIGMYGWMAVVVFLLFGHELDKTGPVFWFEMQIAMLCGFVTSYPVNRWLLKTGIKEKM
ncbi:DUF4396 domain-containing protein [Horticoccus luteus]